MNLQNSIVLITSKRKDRNDIGTGFVIYQDQSASYIVTCAHVVNTITKENVRVRGEDATVIAYGCENAEDSLDLSLDLAVIRVEALNLPPLNLQTNAREKDSFSTKGYFRFDEKTTIQIAEVQGILKQENRLVIKQGKDFIKGWELEITSEKLLQAGYSGSPILNQQQEVIGVVTHELDNGRKGAAISIDALAKCWLEMPGELLINLNVIGTQPLRKDDNYTDDKKNNNSSIKSHRIKTLQTQKEGIETQIAELQNLSNKCTQDIKAEPNAARRSQLNTQIDNYSTEIDKLYNKLENFEKQINQLKLDEKDFSPNNHLNNPKNQQQSKIDESLRYIDFKKALDTFEKIQSQFNTEGDVALFFMEEHLIKRGDLCLQRLRDGLTPKTFTFHRQHFRHCPVTYTSGDLQAVMQGIANFFEVKQEEITPEVVIQKIGNSLQNNSVLFIEIHCDISDSSEIEPLIPWFINYFWQPLRDRIAGLIEDYDGIKVIAIIISDVLLNPKLSTEQLSRYCDDDHHCFSRNKLIQIPLENWTKDDITNWLIKYGNPGLKKSDRNTIANKIYARTQGHPTAVCYALQQQWDTLTCLPTSC